MHGYDTFPTDIKVLCSSLMTKYNLQVLSESAVEVIFKSSRCLLKFVTEYDYVEIRFKQNENDRWMFLGPYLQAQFPNVKLTLPDTREDLSRIDNIRDSLSYKVELIKEYLVPVLEGDFSWKPKYEICEKASDGA